MSGSNPYQAGGALFGASYVVREADKRLENAILDNTRVPYLLAPRQSGKSSRLARTQATVASSDLRLIIVDLTSFSPDCFHSYGHFLQALFLTLLDELHGGDEVRRSIRHATNQERPL